jgi:hypothetical protein
MSQIARFGLAIGALVGLGVGFIYAGIGGAILGAAIGGIAGAIIAAVLAGLAEAITDSLGLILFWIILIGIPIIVLILAGTLWGVGKP